MKVFFVSRSGGVSRCSMFVWKSWIGYGTLGFIMWYIVSRLEMKTWRASPAVPPTTFAASRDLAKPSKQTKETNKSSNAVPIPSSTTKENRKKVTFAVLRSQISSAGVASLATQLKAVQLLSDHQALHSTISQQNWTTGCICLGTTKTLFNFPFTSFFGEYVFRYVVYQPYNCSRSYWLQKGHIFPFQLTSCPSTSAGCLRMTAILCLDVGIRPEGQLQTGAQLSTVVDLGTQGAVRSGATEGVI